MRVGLLRLVLLVVVVNGLLLAWVAAAGAQDTETLAVSGLERPNSMVVPGIEVLDEGQQVRDEEASRLSDPQAKYQRQESRTKFSGMDSGEARNLAETTYPGLVNAVVGGPPALPAGQKLVRFINSNNAQIDLGSGRRAIVAAQEPFATRNTQGGWVPVDLGLEQDGAGFRPINSAVALAFPKRLAEGVTLGDTGVRVVPVDSAGRSLAGSEGTRVGAIVMYANTQQDSDTAIKPTPTGFETTTLLRSAASPTELAFEIHMPANAEMVQTVIGKSAIRVMLGGEELATVQAPRAVDAAGTVVPVTMEADGATIRLTVDHRSGDYQYPIAVDPTITDSQLTNRESPHYGWANWEGQTNNAAIFKVERLLYQWTLYSIYTFKLNDYAQVIYKTQGESQIYKFVSTTQVSTSNSNGIRPAVTIGRVGSTEMRLELPFKYTSTTNTICINSCNPPASPQHNNANFISTAVKEGNEYYEAVITAAEVFITQVNGPSVSWDTADATIGGRANAFYSNGWVNQNAIVGLTASDPGIGISEWAFKWVGHSEAEWGPKKTYLYPNATESGRCYGVQCEPCIGLQCASGARHYDDSTSPVGLAEGEDTIEAKVFDALGMTAATSTHVIKYDNAAPHDITITGFPASHEIGEGQYKLRIKATATDGSGSTPSSGVASMALYIDGQQTGSSSAVCTPGPCSATAEWVVNAETYGVGKHMIKVTATDSAGNARSEEFEITIHHAESIGVGPAQVNPITGAASMNVGDVSIPAGAATLSVERTYSSTQTTAGSTGPLGPQWTMDIGPAQTITKTAYGSAVLTGVDGKPATFYSLGAGKFAPPAGDGNLSLTEQTVGGVIQFVLKTNGVSTTFAPPRGGDGTVWKPSIVEGTTGTNSTTYSFETVAGINEPTEILAPVPGGVSCAPELTRGCRALTFNYAARTTASSDSPAGWGDYVGQLTRIYFTAWDPQAARMTTTTVAQYSYDTRGRLRAEWDPRVSPTLKNLYGYDSEGHLTALGTAGQQPWLLSYGVNQEDPTPGRLVAVSRPVATTTLGEGTAPTNTAPPVLSPSTPVIGRPESTTNASWTTTPLAYTYQWKRCLSGGTSCTVIPGARNQTYVPTNADAGYTLVAQVIGTNLGGSVTTTSTASNTIVGTSPVSSRQFGSLGSGVGNFDHPEAAAIDSRGNVWVADANNNRIQKFTASGGSPVAYGRSGTEGGQFKHPGGVAISPTTGNVYVADTNNNRVQELNSEGRYILRWGATGSEAGKFNTPTGIVVDASGNVYVSDTVNNRVQEFTASGSFIRTIGSEGATDGHFKSTGGLAIALGNLYVVDWGNNRVQEFNEKAEFVQAFGRTGTEGGQFKEPWGIAADPITGDLYVADGSTSNRMEVFSPGGQYLAQFGSYGTTEGHFWGPAGAAVNAAGAIYVVDEYNARIDIWAPKPSAGFGLQFGTRGSGSGQFNGPSHTAVDARGNVWVTDATNMRVEKFTSTGTFIASYGSYGGEGLHFSWPTGIAANVSTGMIYVSDEGNGRIVEISESGEYKGEFGTEGTREGEMKYPDGLAVDGSGNVWVADGGNNRIQEFSATGTFIKAFGSAGTGNGQFNFPSGLTFSNGYVYVLDAENGRVEKFTTGGTYEGQFGSKGYGAGQFESPDGIATDPTTGNLYIADTSNYRLEVFNPAGTYLETIGSSGSGEGQFAKPNGLAFSATGGLYIADYGNNRVQRFATGYSQMLAPAPPTVGSLATTTVAYGVPILGPGSPYGMGSAEVANWGQSDLPAEAMAVFPADEPQTSPASDYRRAAVYYLDTADRVVNVALPGEMISTTEYNTYGDVVRTLTPANRQAALKEGARSAEVSHQLDTQSTFASEGTELSSRIGPLHTVKLASGSVVQARQHSQYYYDEGAPAEGGPYRLVTKSTVGAQIAEKPEEDVRTTVTAYSGQHNLGWQLRMPTSTTTDPSGLKLVRTTLYDRTTGRITETRDAGAGAAREESPVSYTYRSAFGSTGSGNGQLSKPGAMTRDSEGHFWVADTENNQVEEFAANGTYIRRWGTLGSGYGQLRKPEGIAVDPSGNVWVADTGNNRLEEFGPEGSVYNVIEYVGYLTYLKAPKGLAAVQTGEEEGFLYVVDSGNNRVEEIEYYGYEVRSFGYGGSGNGALLEPEGIALDRSGNVWIADSGNNRIEEFSKEGAYLKKFGTRGSGEGQLSRPEGVAIDQQGNVLAADGGNNRIEEFDEGGSYLYQFGRVGTGEGQLKTPADLLVDTSNQAYVLDTGNGRIQTWSWEEHPLGNGGTHATQTIYYSVSANGTYPACGEHSEWAGLVCQTQLAVQPNTAGISNPPITTTTYNIWQEPVTTTETVGRTTRTTRSTYDAVGRVLAAEVSSTVGVALPIVENEYDSTTGALARVRATIEGTSRVLTSAYNTLGQLVRYTDGDENTSTYTYDIDGRTASVNDGKGTQTLSYDPTSGAVTRLEDSGAGIFTATYAASGRLASVGYPNGMAAEYTYNPVNEATGVKYTKTTNCSSGCTWYADTVTPSIGGQWLSQESSLSSQAYTYDQAGRLTRVQDTPTGEGCTTRLYEYDTETNRTKTTTRAPGVGGACATEGGTSETHTFDGANRLTDTGVAYDTYGDITRLPAADAGGTELVSTYYAGGRVATQAQNGETLTYRLDPVGRPREVVASGTTNATTVQHYSGPSESPAWSVTGGKWTRNIPGIGGGLAAIQAEGEQPILQISNLHGDVIATASISETSRSLLSTTDTTEYGVPRTRTPPKYSWLGDDGSTTELPSGVTAMGARSYVPQLGMFLQTDPVAGGSANAYGYTFGDPVNTADPSGEHTWAGETNENEAYGAQVAAEMVAAEAAREAAARAEAEIKITGDIDPAVYYTWREAHERAVAFRVMTLAQFIAEEVGEIGAVPLELLEDWLIKDVGLKAIDKWFETAEEGLERCAINDIYKMGAKARARMSCRFEYHLIKLKIPLTKIEVSITNFWWSPRTALCTSHNKHCHRLV